MTEKFKYCIARLGLTRLKQIAYMSVMLIAVLLVLAFSVNKITVNDGSRVQTLYSLKSQPTELLKMATLSSQSYKVTEVTEKGNKIDISLSYTLPVFVTLGNDTKEISVLKGSTVSSAISEAGITLDEYDIVNLPLDSIIEDTTYIDVIDINYVTEKSLLRIPYTSKTIYSNKTSVKSITTAGQEGVKEVVKLTKMVNGVAESTETVSETIVKEAVQQVITVGTKKKVETVVTADNKVPGTISVLSPSTPIELDANGNPVTYKQHITVQATAYTAAPGKKGASGVVVKPGHVAINTNIFPYGTKFYIKSSDGRYIYGYAVAADTGGFVATQPKNFDLYFSTEAECTAFGRRNIEVYVLY